VVPTGERHAGDLRVSDERTDRAPASQQMIGLGRRLANWRTLGSAALAVALLVFLFRILLRIDLGETLALIGDANPLYLLVAFAAYYLTFPLRALRWRYILSRAGTRVGARDATEIFCVAWFVNCLVPARLGDVYRAYLLRADTGAALSRTFGTLFIERLADILGVFAVALVAGLWSFRGRIGPEVGTLLIIGIVLSAGLIALVLGLHYAGGFVSERLPATGARLWDRFRHGTDASLSPPAIGLIGLTTAFIWTLEGLRLYLVISALALPEITVGFSAALFVAQISALFSIIPLTPAGTGFVEAGLIYALTLYGVPTGAAAAAAIADRAITLVSVVFFGAILYLASGKVRRGFLGDTGTDRERGERSQAARG
jgi:glycosyltransferase 2 family protein